MAGLLGTVQNYQCYFLSANSRQGRTHPPPSCLLFWCFVTLGVYLRVFTHGIPFIITCVYLDDSLDIF